MLQNKTLRRLGAILLAGTMTVSAMAVSASAEESTAATTATFTKTVTKGSDTYAPNTTFTFTVENGAADTSKKISAGQGGVTVGSAEFAPQASDIGATAVSKDVTVTIAKNTFTTPGIYHYIISEAHSSYDGITSDTSKHDLYIYVVSDDAGKLSISTANLTGSEGTKLGGFTNTYATADLTVGKKVTGSIGDRNKTFNFTVTINGTAGETYKVVTAGGSEEVGTANEDGVASIRLAMKHGETATIYGLSTNDTYTYTEEEANADNYTTTGQVTTAVAMGTEDKTVTIVNDRDATPTTGVMLTAAPYAAMLTVAAGTAFLFLRKRHVEE